MYNLHAWNAMMTIMVDKKDAKSSKSIINGYCSRGLKQCSQIFLTLAA